MSISEDFNRSTMASVRPLLTDLWRVVIIKEGEIEADQNILTLPFLLLISAERNLRKLYRRLDQDSH